MIEIRSLRDVVRVFFIFRREFMVAAVTASVLTVMAAFFLPHKFTSDARLLVRPGRENMTVPIDATDRQTVAPQSTTRDPIIDEEKMLTGRPVLIQVAQFYLAETQSLQKNSDGFVGKVKSTLKNLKKSIGQGLSSGLAKLGLTEERSEEEVAAEKLADRFQVSHGPGSNVMELSFTWDDPEIAQRVLQRWIQVYLDERAKALGHKGLVTFYEDKVRLASEEIESAKSQLRDRLEQINGTSAQERLDSLNKRINDLHTRLAEIAAERNALGNSIQYAADRARSIPKESVTERDLSQSPTWHALNNQLADLKRQRTDALRLFKESAPTVVALNESIASLETQLKAEDAQVQRGEKRTPNELSSTLEKNQLEKSVRLQELHTLFNNFEKEVASLEAERRSVLEHEPELASLEQALASAEKSRGLYLDSLEKARIDQALDSNRINNIAQIQAATFNPVRTSPKSLLLLMLALPAGGFIGLAVVYLCSVFDQRIHDGGLFEARLGVPVWSQVKDISLSGPDNDFHASLYRIYGTLPLDRVVSEGLVLGLASARAGEGVSFIAARLKTLLQSQGIKVEINPPTVFRQPGQVILLEASALNSNQDAFVLLSKADLIVLVVEAYVSTLPVVENALGMLRTAFHQVHGVIINRRRFEVPTRVLRWLKR